MTSVADQACFFLGCGSPPRYTVTYVEIRPKLNDCCGRHLSAAAEVALKRVPTCTVEDFDPARIDGHADG